MADYSTAVSIKGREVSFKGMATVHASSADLAEKIISSRKLKGEIKEVEGSRLSVTLGKGVMRVEFNGRLNPKAIMPGDHVTIENNIKSIDSSGIGELNGGSLEMVLEPNHLF